MVKIILAQRLGELGLKKADLQRATGIRMNTICDYYNGDKGSIDLFHLDQICESLHCEIGDILIRVPNEKPVAEKAVRRER